MEERAARNDTHKKTRIGRCGFSDSWAFAVLRLVADPHRPRTIIRAQIVAVGVIEVGEAKDHGADANGSFSMAQLFQRQRRRQTGHHSTSSRSINVR
ncbi:hypothetical protein XHV734_1624 [Xanthomonas hortorum pv. vitians]|nr:hypothetical protein XHV734_1624 [Xanthomonas hortorum pv. vitians]